MAASSDKVKNPCGTSLIILALTALQILDESRALRLTNMSAPALQDPRKDMELHCRFDMGGEELYAVKWYKDDHEFFRYTPAARYDKITQFPVEGVRVESQKTRCMPEGCDLLLTNLSRPLSSGAYRCEVSTEAPAFRLASQTHNVTVAAVPEDRPRLDIPQEIYSLGDTLKATCTSGYGDPRPIITWFVNKNEIYNKFGRIRELTPAGPSEKTIGLIRLKNRISQLILQLDKDLTGNKSRAQLDISCSSSAEGIRATVAPHLTTTKTIVLVDQDQLVNNQKLHSFYASGDGASRVPLTALCAIIVLVRWC